MTELLVPTRLHVLLMGALCLGCASSSLPQQDEDAQAALDAGGEPTTDAWVASPDTGPGSQAAPAARACRMGENCERAPQADRDAAAGPSQSPCYGGCTSQVERPTPGARPLCPAVSPELAQACDSEDTLCTYGDEPTAFCRSAYRCSAGAWERFEPVNGVGCGELPTDYCPQAPQHEQDCVIGPFGSGVACVYDDELLCYCITAGFSRAPGSEGIWRCYGPPEDARCPARLPHLGQGCDTNGVQCTYAVDGCSALPFTSVFCFDGAWEEGEPQVCL